MQKTTTRTEKARAVAATHQCSACARRPAMTDRDVCPECSHAYTDSIRRRRDAALRLAPLADGRRDPWGGAA